MGLSSSILQPQELITFKKLPTTVPLDHIEIPERPENRKSTNVKWLITFGVFIFILLPFMIYTLYYSDLRRFIIGYDKCGNICGVSNYKWADIPCSGQNLTYKKYLQYENEDFHGGEVVEDFRLLERHCVESCRSGYTPILSRCVKSAKSENLMDTFANEPEVRKGNSDNMQEYFHAAKWHLIISSLLSILVGIGMLFLFRYAVAFVVWGIMIGCFFGILILVGGMWYLYSVSPEKGPDGKDGPKTMFLVFSIALTILAVVLGIVLIWFRKKIRLVILLLKEATKAVFDMPKLIFLPVICVISILILTALFALTSAVMYSAGHLKLLHGDYYHYQTNAVMIFTMSYNLVVYLWVTQFFTGIQYMIVAGAVAKWYFARDKMFLGNPILTSASNAFKYHLGSVALGAMIITFIQVIKTIILSLIQNSKVRSVVESCVESIESFFKFLSKNAYIITAMHGQAFIRSGKRAAKLIIQNVSDIIAVNYIGDFVLGMTKFLIVVISLLVSVGVFATLPSHYAYGNWASYIIVAIVSALVASVTFGVFETTIDTLFICYCEDNILNDGMAKPYFMSRNLMEFVQSSKEVYGKK